MLGPKSQPDAPDLTALPLRTLLRELERRGYEAHPAGLFQLAVNSASEKLPEGLVEAPPGLLEELGEIARRFPPLVEAHKRLGEDNLALGRRVAVAESEVTAPAGVILAELDDAHGTTDDNGDDN